MSNRTGHIKGYAKDKNGYKTLKINSLGENDNRNYYQLSVFGFDYKPPKNTRALTIMTENKDVKIAVGVLNKVFSELNEGESVIFSTSADGSELKTFMKFLNDGTAELNGNSDFMVGFNELKAGFDQLKTDLNNLITIFNTHIHTGVISGSSQSGTTSTTSTTTTASVDGSKKDNLKIE